MLVIGGIVWGMFGIGWYGLFVDALAEKVSHRWTGQVFGWALALNQVVIVAVPLIIGITLVYHWLLPYMVLCVVVAGAGTWSMASNASRGLE